MSKIRSFKESEIPLRIGVLFRRNGANLRSGVCGKDKGCCGGHLPQQGGNEFHARQFGRKALQIGDPAADGPYPVAPQFFFVRRQKFSHALQIAVNEHGAVMQQPAAFRSGGAAGDFKVVYAQIISPVVFRLDAETLQRGEQRVQKCAKQIFAVTVCGQEGEVEVAHVLIHRSAAGGAANNGNSQPSGFFQINFSRSVLVFPNDDAGAVAPDQQQILAAAGKEVCLQREIPRRVMAGDFKAEHGASPPLL